MELLVALGNMRASTQHQILVRNVGMNAISSKDVATTVVAKKSAADKGTAGRAMAVMELLVASGNTDALSTQPQVIIDAITLMQACSTKILSNC